MKQGDFVWYELCSTQSAAAAAFYERVMGWKPTKPETFGIDYTILNQGERPVAGIVTLPPEQMPPRPIWCGYIAVDDVDAKAAEVLSAGGKTHVAPQDIPSVGRFAVLADPDGALFMLFKGQSEEPPPPAMMQPGSIGWHELHAKDWEKSWSFYSTLFGWTKDKAHEMGPMGMYQTFRTGDTSCGGMMTDAQSPYPYWLYYFVVDDIDAGVERVQAAGGKLLFGPQEVPGGAWIINAEDPQGGLFALVGQRRR